MRQAHFSSWGVVQWRVLNWAEFNKFKDALNTKGSMAVSNDIYRACILTGPHVQDATAGLVEFVASDVFSSTAFTGDFDTLQPKIDKARSQVANNILLSAAAVISGIFGYKFEEIEKWDEDELMLRWAQAEFVAGKPLEMERSGPKPVQKAEDVIPIDTNKIRTPLRDLTLAQKLVADRVRGN